MLPLLLFAGTVGLAVATESTPARRKRTSTYGYGESIALGRFDPWTRTRNMAGIRGRPLWWRDAVPDPDAARRAEAEEGFFMAAPAPPGSGAAFGAGSLSPASYVERGKERSRERVRERDRDRVQRLKADGCRLTASSSFGCLGISLLGRRLDEDEIGELRRVFGDTLPYRTIRVRTRPFAGWKMAWVRERGTRRRGRGR